jgi:hypothetical protein
MAMIRAGHLSTVMEDKWTSSWKTTVLSSTEVGPGSVSMKPTSLGAPSIQIDVPVPTT